MKDRRSAEELREALIDLDRAREHERQMRLQTETLLEGLRVLTQAQNTRDLFVELLSVLRRFVPFEAAFLLQEAADGMLEVTQSTSAAFESLRWARGSLSERVASGRIVPAFDIADVPEWQAWSGRIQGVCSALHVPLHTTDRCSMLVLSHAQRAFFDKQHVDMLERFAPLTRQAMAASNTASAWKNTPRASNSSPPTTRSPACPTACCWPSASSTSSRTPGGKGRCSPCCSSTWTASSTSTTASATDWVTSC